MSNKEAANNFIFILTEYFSNIMPFSFYLSLFCAEYNANTSCYLPEAISSWALFT